MTRDSFSKTKRFDISHNTPTIVHGDSRLQGRLAPVWDPIANGLEKLTIGFILDLRAVQVGRKRVETLTDRAVAVVIVAMALGTIG